MISLCSASTYGLSMLDMIINSSMFWGFGLGIGIALTVIYYFLSKILNSAEIEKRSYQSLIGLLETIGLIAVLILVSGFFNYFIQTSAGFNCNSGIIHLQLAEAALIRYWHLVETRYLVAYGAETIMSVLFAVHLPLPTTAGAHAAQVVLAPAYPFHILLQAHGKLIEYLVYILIAIIGRSYILLTSYYFATILIGLGLFFRALNFTRSFGSSIIALAIVLYYVFPLSVLFTDYIVTEVYKPDLQIIPTDPKMQAPFFPTNQQALDNYIKTVSPIYEALNNPVTLSDIENTYSQQVQQNKPKPSLWTWLKSAFKDSFSKSFKGLVFGFTTIAFSQTIKSPIIDRFLTWLQRVPYIGAVAVFIKTTAGVVSIFGYIGIIYTMNSFFALFTSLYIQFMVVLANMAVIVLLSLILEITISVTAYKEISKLLGGEPLMFALSKLV